jgi:hypothetical protein
MQLTITHWCFFNYKILELPDCFYNLNYKRIEREKKIFVTSLLTKGNKKNLYKIYLFTRTYGEITNHEIIYFAVEEVVGLMVCTDNNYGSSIP